MHASPRIGAEVALAPVQLTAVGLLPNLETAQRERSVLLLDEQNLLLKEGERGLHRTPKWIFMSS
jgi:hypothetical protein